MGDLGWTHKQFFTVPLSALRQHIVCLGASGSGKTETLYRLAYGARRVYGLQVIYLDAKGEEKQGAEYEEDTAARFVAAMRAAGASRVAVFPATLYNGWLGTPTVLANRLLSVIDFSESPYYADVAAHAVSLALHTPVTPRSSTHFLANLRPERLERLYQDHPAALWRVKHLDRHLLAQVQMRYDVFFHAMADQLDGPLTYRDVDAAYLRVHGFTLRQEAPRLGRFLVYDVMHYIAERKAADVRTLFIIDEFNALRLREEMSVLFEQVRSFGGSLIIAAQGYAGLGPPEVANRILDAANTYILHACSDPFPVSRRAGKRIQLSTSWSEAADGTSRRHIRAHQEWKVPEDAVMQQTTGQAFWIHHGHAQQALTVRLPLTREQVEAGWDEIRRQQETQRLLLAQRAPGKSAPRGAPGSPNSAPEPP